MENKIIIKDLAEYGNTELASKYKSSAGSQQKVDSKLIDQYLEIIGHQGYIIIPNLLNVEKLQAIKADLYPRFQHSSGRNNFEGFKTQRLYATIAKTFIVNDLVEHPIILGLLDRLFKPNYLLSQLQPINILPGEVQQPLHYDDAFYDVPRPRKPFGAAAVWAIDDFTENNGATVVIPGSHLWGPAPPTEKQKAEQISVVMPAGSVVFFLGTLWHGGGANRSEDSRLAVSPQYCEPWCRQQENYSLSIPLEIVKQCSENIKRLLGYSIHNPFMGFVNGMHPKRLLED